MELRLVCVVLFVVWHGWNDAGGCRMLKVLD